MSGQAEFWLAYRPLGGDSDAVRMVDEARAAVLRDTARRAQSAGFGRVRVFASVSIAGLKVERTPTDARIGDVVASASSDLDAAVCWAGSGMPAMTVSDWAGVLAEVEGGQACANRVFSCDWVAVPHGRMLAVAAGESVDNRFAQLVRDRGDVELAKAASSARTLLDLDTPADLAVLAACAEVGSLPIGEELAEVLERWRELLVPTVARASAVFEVMTRRDAELLVCGRVSGSDWALVDRDTSCRVRVLSEERGLRVRESRARSLLGMLYESVGSKTFLARLAEMGDAVIWDTRPFYAHLGWTPSPVERFEADLGRWGELPDGPHRELVRALSASERPVLLGGHSLVSGGLRAGIDEAWTRLERGQ